MRNVMIGVCCISLSGCGGEFHNAEFGSTSSHHSSLTCVSLSEPFAAVCDSSQPPTAVPASKTPSGTFNKNSPYETAPRGLSTWGHLGLGEPILENTILKNWDLDIQLNKIVQLRPTLFRLWITGDFLYDTAGHPTSTHLPKFQAAIDRLYNAGIQIMGMQNYFPAWMSGADGTTAENWNTIPCLSAVTQHREFLIRYEANWRRMAELFPKIKIWEPANETNGIGSVKPIQVGPGSCGKAQFTHTERVIITIELMERAHRAIKSVNPSALVFMPPPGPQNDELALSGPNGSNDVQLVTISRFIKDIYAAIASWNGNPRSYFDGISWHPYIFQAPTQSNWVVANQSIYNIISASGDGQLPIIFSEVGNSEMDYDPASGGLAPRSAEELASWLQDSVRLTQSQMPWVSHVIWFRAFDDQLALAWGGEHQKRFGIMHDDYPSLSKKTSSDIFCKFTGCVNEPFKAYSSSGWKVFWINGSSYCEYETPEQFALKTGMDLDATLPWLAALDPGDWTYSGTCHSD